jgi:hypothetical protein
LGRPAAEVLGVQSASCQVGARALACPRGPSDPRYNEDGVSISEWASEWILAERYVGERIEDLSPGHNLSVNIWSYNDPRAPKKIAFDDVDLTLEYLGEVAFTADALPEPRDPTKA